MVVLPGVFPCVDFGKAWRNQEGKSRGRRHGNPNSNRMERRDIRITLA
jgi:hypothetical protein